MKKIIVTDKNIENIQAFQGTSTPVSIGEELDVVYEEKGKNGILYLTNWLPTYNTLKMIERGNEEDAKLFGWDIGAEINKKAVEEKKDAVYFKRYTINKNNV